jgi:hypothetical protein
MPTNATVAPRFLAALEMTQLSHIRLGTNAVA